MINAHRDLLVGKPGACRYTVARASYRATFLIDWWRPGMDGIVAEIGLAGRI
jgi:hypothetical protein